MSSKIAIVYEGEETESRLFENIEKNFFRDDKFTLVHFPAAENIHMLAQRIKDDEYLNIIEVIREHNAKAAEKLNGYTRDDFEGVYLFFDLDPQDRGNYSEENLNMMLSVFDDETGNGKLYISYPMIEAIRDLKLHDSCKRRCVYDIRGGLHYKTVVGDMKEFMHFQSYDFNKWQPIFQHAVKKANCIVFEDNLENCGKLYTIPDREVFINRISQKEIYWAQQRKFISNGKVAILSSVPLFLLEYMKPSFWKSFVSK